MEPITNSALAQRLQVKRVIINKIMGIEEPERNVPLDPALYSAIIDRCRCHPVISRPAIIEQCWNNYRKLKEVDII